MLEIGPHNKEASIKNLGLVTKRARYNARETPLLETALQRNEGRLSRSGGLVVSTGQYTGRSPSDKHIVDEKTSTQSIWWEGNNRISPEHFEILKTDLFDYLKSCEVEVQDLECGADSENSVSVRLVAELSWHALFLRHLLRRPDLRETSTYVPDYTIVNAPGFKADPKRHGTKSETVIVISFDQKIVLIGGTEYAGENKKAAFTIMNHIYPAVGILPMHCSATDAKDGVSGSAIFFGLSGTGKTTLSSDPTRLLIGDDEHGWSDSGVFNFEGGCYAKTIKLSREAEPDIWHATHSPATVLENVVIDPESRQLDLDDNKHTENTRAAYPLSILNNTSPDSKGAAPKNIFLLTCDAYGVTPPVSRLTPKQARTFFLLGFTSKVAGTERGVVGATPTFSTCFGAPFLTRNPEVYADMFEDRVSRSDAKVWLINTGWTGGGAQNGKRMPIRVTRLLINAVLDGDFEAVSFRRDPLWGTMVPETGPRGTVQYLNPRSNWEDKDEYDKASADLASMISQRLLDQGIENDLIGQF
ncbi:phosphoenolpyruvate carboxykinase (ATP) [Ruegeria atlantica]|uniref:phosphoenolpyruvate carboxykinase (ATP) n=1 Tax=Ruegeria atlantica TaxID=81569 RepID=UPI00147FB9FF|nr:phosphoenolpyruvate carboxykinase (ATP) [Ruegeria atlantica]